MKFSRSLTSLAVAAAGVKGARRTSKRATSPGSSKFIAGVPVLNYHTAYSGKASLAQVDMEADEQEWVLMLKPQASTARMEMLCKTSKQGCKLAGHSSLAGGVPFLELRGTEADLEAIIMKSNDAIKYIEPDSEVHMIPEITPTDNGFGTGGAATWGLNRINAGQRGRTGTGATVFVLDTGVRSSHEEFSGRSSSALDLTSGSPVVCNSNLNCANDRQGHGTHCAGTAAGVTYGVAPTAKVEAVKVLDDSGSGYWSWSYYALDWLATSTVRPAVASMSLGGSGTQQAMKDAVDGAVNAGVVVVVAGGNSNADACDFSPAFVPSAITVGSMTSNDARSSFSNYGSCTNIWAPGSDVWSCGVCTDSAASSKSGTSMACPHVSGAAALVLEADPTKKPSAVLQELLDTATRNVLSDLKAGDTNALLNVADPSRPTPAPTAAPTPFPGECLGEFFCDTETMCSASICEGCPWCNGVAPAPTPPPVACHWICSLSPSTSCTENYEMCKDCNFCCF